MPQEIDLRQVMEDAGGYALECYPFIRDGLAHTVDITHGREPQAEPGSGDDLLDLEDDESRHVSGQQLCMGLLDFARRQYGLLAKTVLNRWGIRCTEDYGKIVFAMIDAGLMRKTEEDSIEDFQDVYDFDEVFGEPVPAGAAPQEQLS